MVWIIILSFPHLSERDAQVFTNNNYIESDGFTMRELTANQDHEGNTN